MSAKTTLNKLGKLLSKKTPTILTGIGVGGVIATALFAMDARLKAQEILDDELENRVNQSKNGEIEPMTIKDKAKLTWKCYIPTVVMGTTTIACIVSANSINEKRKAALASLYSLSEVTMREYKKQVIDTIGSHKEQTISDNVSKTHIEKNPVQDKEVIITGGGDVLFYEVMSGRYFNGSMEKVRKVENDLNAIIFSDPIGLHISLNDMYYHLGLKGTQLGDEMGWCIDNLLKFKFSTQLTEDDRPCVVLDFENPPQYEFL